MVTHLTHFLKFSILFFFTASIVGCGESTDPIEEKIYKEMSTPNKNWWNSFRNGPERTGYSSTAKTGRTVTEIWRVKDINTDSYGAAKGSPSVDDDTVYIGSDGTRDSDDEKIAKEARFSAFDRATGELKWEVSFKETTEGIHGSPYHREDGLYRSLNSSCKCNRWVDTKH